MPDSTMRRLDRVAHKGARRIAVSGLAGLVLYWGVVFKLSEWLLFRSVPPVLER